MNFSSLFLAAIMAAQPAAAPSAGDLAFQHGDFDAAYAAFSATTAATPDDADALLGLGTIELYRNDLADARTHLTKAAQLDPNNPAAAARLRALEGREPSATEYQISMRRDEIDIPFVATDPLPMFRATIDGTNVLLVLDTGAPDIALTAATAAKLHIATHAVGRGVFAGGKTAEMRGGRVDSFAVPGLSVHGIPMSVVPGTPSFGKFAPDGVVGTAFLSRFLSTIDYAGGRLVLRPRSASNAFERTASGDGASVVPMWLVGDHFIIARAHIGDAADGLFNIDTGGPGMGVQLTKPALAAAQISPDMSKSVDGMGGGGLVHAVPFVAPSVTVGSATRTQVPGLYFPDGDQFGLFPFTVTGAISHEFFRHGAVTFDFDAMKMIVK